MHSVQMELLVPVVITRIETQQNRVILVANYDVSLTSFLL